MEDMESTINSSLTKRLRNFFIACAAVFSFVFIFLPFLTSSCDILSRMAVNLDENGIDPSRYYYTDVEQVKEAEQYLESVLKAE